MNNINERGRGASTNQMKTAASNVFKNIYKDVKTQRNADYSKIFAAVKQGANAPGKLPLDPAAMEIVPWVEDVVGEMEGMRTLFSDSDVLDVAYDVAEQLLNALRKDGLIPLKGMREGKSFRNFRKQLNEQVYALREGAVKAAMEDWIESLPKAVVDEINKKYADKLKKAQLTGLSKGDPVRKALIDLLNKHKVKPALGDPSRDMDISALELMFVTVFGESVAKKADDEVEEETIDELTVPQTHALAIARKTVKMNDAMVGVMGGMNKKQAHEFLLKHGTPAEKKAAEKYLGVKEEVEIEEAMVSYALVVDNKIVFRGNKQACLKLAKKEHGGLKQGKVFITQTPKEVGDKFQKEEWKSLKKTRADLNALRASGKRVTVQHGEGDTLYRVSKPKKKPVKGESDQIDEVSSQETLAGGVVRNSLVIARKTVKMNDVMARIMGGMSKKKAHEFLLQHGTSKEKAAAKAFLGGVKEAVNVLSGAEKLIRNHHSGLGGGMTSSFRAIKKRLETSPKGSVLLFKTETNSAGDTESVGLDVYTPEQFKSFVSGLTTKPEAKIGSKGSWKGGEVMVLAINEEYEKTTHI